MYYLFDFCRKFAHRHLTLRIESCERTLDIKLVKREEMQFFKVLDHPIVVAIVAYGLLRARAVVNKLPLVYDGLKANLTE